MHLEIVEASAAKYLHSGGSGRGVLPAALTQNVFDFMMFSEIKITLIFMSGASVMVGNSSYWKYPPLPPALGGGFRELSCDG